MSDPVRLTTGSPSTPSGTSSTTAPRRGDQPIAISAPPLPLVPPTNPLPPAAAGAVTATPAVVAIAPGAFAPVGVHLHHQQQQQASGVVHHHHHRPAQLRVGGGNDGSVEAIPQWSPQSGHDHDHHNLATGPFVPTRGIDSKVEQSQPLNIAAHQAEAWGAMESTSASPLASTPSTSSSSVALLASSTSSSFVGAPIGAPVGVAVPAAVAAVVDANMFGDAPPTTSGPRSLGHHMARIFESSTHFISTASFEDGTVAATGASIGQSHLAHVVKVLLELEVMKMIKLFSNHFMVCQIHY
jgi:hypothetical protein